MTSSTCDDIMTSFHMYYVLLSYLPSMPIFGIVYSGTTHNSSGPYKTLAAPTESTLSYNTDNRRYFGMQPQVPLPAPDI